MIQLNFYLSFALGSVDHTFFLVLFNIVHVPFSPLAHNTRQTYLVASTDELVYVFYIN